MPGARQSRARRRAQLSHRPYHEEPPEDLEDLDAGAVVLFLAVVLAAVVLAAVALGAAS